MPLPPRISIVTPSYNQAKYLEECMDSVLSQGYPNLEYIVMDGGSTDGSVEIIKKYAKYLTYWQSCPDGGQYAAINAGFAHTTGEVMAWLNSDDRYHPNAFLKVACAFSEWPEVNWITGRRTTYEENGFFSGIDRFFPQFSRRKMLSGHIDKPFIMQEATFWRRRLWEKVGGRLDTSYTLAADTELWIRYFREDRLYVLDALLGGFRQQDNNRSTNNISKYHEEARGAISRELASFQDNEFFEIPPPQLKIATETYLSFAATFSIPRFKPCLKPLWQTYLFTIKDWIVNRKGGLEAASIFHDEIALWQDSDEYDIPSLIHYLHKCLEFKRQAEALIHVGETRYYNGDLAGALKATFEALDIWPTSPDGNNNLATLLYYKGKMQEAIEYLLLATQYDVGKRESYQNLAIIFHELGQYDKVQWALEYYLAWFPEDREMEQFYRRMLECR